MADSHAKNHDYHLVDPSPWPAVGAVAAFFMAIGGIAYMRAFNDDELVLLGVDVSGSWLLIIGTIGVLYTMFMWWRDIIREGDNGDHIKVVQPFGHHAPRAPAGAGKTCLFVRGKGHVF